VCARAFSRRQPRRRFDQTGDSVVVNDFAPFLVRVHLQLALVCFNGVRRRPTLPPARAAGLDGAAAALPLVRFALDQPRARGARPSPRKCRAWGCLAAAAAAPATASMMGAAPPARGARRRAR